MSNEDSSKLILNPTIETQLNHVTTRSYTDEPLSEDVINTLFAVAQQSPTSSFLQQTTIIRVTDPKIREQIYQSSQQPYVGGDRGELFIFVIDLYRNAVIRERMGLDQAPLESLSTFNQGFEDAIIAAQNMVVAAESLGLGTTYLGSVIRDASKVIDALNLPPRTFPVVGLLVGHPTHHPEQKPRLPQEITVALNTYPDPESDSYREAFANYDQIIRDYYANRDSNQKLSGFTELVTYGLNDPISQIPELLDLLHEQQLALH